MLFSRTESIDIGGWNKWDFGKLKVEFLSRQFANIPLEHHCFRATKKPLKAAFLLAKAEAFLSLTTCTFLSANGVLDLIKPQRLPASL